MRPADAGKRAATWLRAGGRALRDFLRGFTGLPAAGALGDTPLCRHDARSARETLEARARRRGTCC